MVLEVVVVLFVVALVTAVVWLLGVVGTKEKSFEEAIAEQQQRHTHRHLHTKKKKVTNTKSSRPSTKPSPTITAASAGADHQPPTSEEDEMDVQLHQIQQERERIKMERQKQKERKEQEKMKRQQEQEDITKQEELDQQEQQDRLEKERQKELKRVEEEEAEKAKQTQQEELLKQTAAAEVKRQEESAAASRNNNNKAANNNKNTKNNNKQTTQQTKKTGGLTNGAVDMVEDTETYKNSRNASNSSSGKQQNGAVNTTTNANAKKTGGKQSPILFVKDEDMMNDLLQTTVMVQQQVNGAAVNGSMANGGAAINNGKAGKQPTVRKQPTGKAGVSTVIKAAENAQLSSEQLQTVVDKLLAMSAEGGWSDARKGSDAGLSKRLEEAAVTIARQQEAHATLTTRISEMRTELNSERSKVTTLKKTVDKSNLEITRLGEKEQHTAGQVQQQIKQQVMQAIAEDRISINRDFEEKMRRMEAASSSREETALQQQQQQQLSVQRLDMELAAAKSQVQQVQYQSDASGRELSEAESRVHAAHAEIARLNAAVEAHTHHIHALEQEKTNLATLASETVREAADGQETQDAQTQDMVSRLEGSLEAEQERVSQLGKECAQLQQSLHAASTKNDELRNKNRTVLEALQSTEDRLMQSDQSSVASLQSCEEGYRQMLQRLFPGVQMPSTSLDSAAFIAQYEASASKEREVEVVEVVVEKVVQDPLLQQTIDTLQQEKTDLQNKLTEAEKRLSQSETSLTSSQQEVQKQRDQLEQQQQSERSSAVDAAAIASKTITSLQEQNKALQEKVAHYQGVLDNTESLLTTLQASVESEESKWLTVVQEKEENLLKAVQENKTLQDKLLLTAQQDKSCDELESELATVKEEKTKLEERLSAAQKEKAMEVGSLQELVTVGKEACKEQDVIIDQLQQELRQSKTAVSESNGPQTTDADVGSDVQQQLE